MIYKIGHAGAAGHAPANTLASIKKAVELGVDMIEFDVRRCKSGEVVLMHDETVNRTTNGRGKINSLTLKELRGLIVENEEVVPTLEEALDVIDKKTEVNIELKSVDSAEPVAEIILKYKKEKGWNLDDFLVSSFKIKALEIFHAINPEAKIGILTNLPTFKTLNIAKKLQAYSININHMYVSEQFFKKAHREGFKIFVFTANNFQEIENLKIMGADGIFSDYPEKI